MTTYILDLEQCKFNDYTKIKVTNPRMIVCTSTAELLAGWDDSKVIRRMYRSIKDDGEEIIWHHASGAHRIEKRLGSPVYWLEITTRINLEETSGEIRGLEPIEAAVLLENMGGILTDDLKKVYKSHL